MIGLQVILMLSGNLSFLNWLTIVPALACFDDRFWARILPAALVREAKKAEARGTPPTLTIKIVIWTLTGIVGLLSIQPVVNLLSPEQVMNTSFDPLNLVNTY